jgi:hypothetical protein
LDIGAPGRGELRLRVHAFGFNRAEAMWHVFGAAEAAGGATGFRIGDKDSTIPAFSMNQYGIYGEQAIVPICARRGVHDLKHPIIVFTWQTALSAPRTTPPAVLGASVRPYFFNYRRHKRLSHRAVPK